MATVEKWVGLGSAMAGLALLWSKMMPAHVHDEVRNFITAWMPMVASYFNSYEQVIISEYSGEQLSRSKLFDATEAYLGERCLKGAHKLKADLGKESADQDSDLPQPQLQVTLDENQDITDNFEGARVWWNLSRQAPKNLGNVIGQFGLQTSKKEPQLYRAVFHKRDRQLVLGTYLRRIVLQGRQLTAAKMQSRLFTCSPRMSEWTHVPFEHPATFDKLAMDPDKKKEIIDDLRAFQQGKDYYSKVGKAWKRGYLLYGPPGTGKSTMISAMANFLKYDVYDLDLTSVGNNATLLNLFVHTTGKSITVIEDIDAIVVDLTTKRKNKDDDENILVNPFMHNSNRVTLSGLLRFVDGLWSACGGGRIIVFTTNHVDRLDPALTRRGRMDKHIEMPYCRFEAFKMLARNYLDVTDHQRFGEIQRLLEDEETNMSPADVTHYLMPKCNKRKRDADECLYKHLHKYRDDCFADLVEALKKAKKNSAAATSTQQKGKAKKFRD